VRIRALDSGLFRHGVFLLVPPAQALSLRTGKDYMLYVLAICAGGVITHGTVPPTPGPLVVAEILKIDLGLTIVGGILFGIMPALVGLAFSRWANRRYPVPVRETSGSTLASLEEVAARREDQLPGFWVSIAPVILPVILIAAASSIGLVRTSVAPAVVQTIEFFGNKNIALLIGASDSWYARQKKIGMKEMAQGWGPAGVAGVIILYVGWRSLWRDDQEFGRRRFRAGGRGGQCHQLRPAGVGAAAVVRVAQGSATVAMITASSIMLDRARGFGAYVLHFPRLLWCHILSWMNDSGFWVISRLGGLTLRRCARDGVLTIISIAGLAQILVAAKLWPNLWF
jgi:GntP family gluconate:H+ symporter